MIFVIKLKKYVANIGIFVIIVSKFSYKKKLYPIILFKIHKNQKIGFYYNILSLSLIIYYK